MATQIYVNELMQTNVCTVTLKTDFPDVIQKMRSLKSSCAIVLEGRTPIGIITERDMLCVLDKIFSTSSLDNLQVFDFMTYPPVTIKSNADIYDALVLTQVRDIRHIPVVNDNEHLLGIITATEIAGAHQKVIETQREIIEDNVREATEELNQANEKLKALSLEDSALKIANHRAFLIDIRYLHRNAQRYNRDYSLLLVELDFFTAYINHYGETYGTTALKMALNNINVSIRDCDRVYAYSEAQFIVLLPETAADSSLVVAKRILKKIHSNHFPNEHSPFKVLTASIGISGFIADSEESHILELVTTHLETAKKLGFNQVCAD